MIPVSKPFIPKSTWKDIQAILNSGQLVEGQRCQNFSNALSDYLKVPHAILVNSGTSALYLALKVLDIGPGDSVLLPAFSFPATANVISWVGAEPVFTDINSETWNMDLDCIKERLKNLSNSQIKKIKAIMPVQTFGNPVDIKPIISFAKSKGWKVIEDAACALGSTLAEKAAGTHGDIGCYSFHPRKILTTSEGGALVLKSKIGAKKLTLLKNHGMIKNKNKILFPEIGLNLRFTEIAAAIGLGQLQILSALVKERINLVEYYKIGLKNLGMITQRPVENAKPNWQSLVARLPVKKVAARNQVFKSLSKRNIQVTIGTYFLPTLPQFKSVNAAMVMHEFPVAQQLFTQGISLPIYHKMQKQDIDFVLAGLKNSI